MAWFGKPPRAIRLPAPAQRIGRPALSLPQLGAGGADIAGSEVRGRVDALGGRLTLESRLGGDTQLRAEIPMTVIRASDDG